VKEREGKEREGKEREGKGREGKENEGKGKERESKQHTASPHTSSPPSQKKPDTSLVSSTSRDPTTDQDQKYPDQGRDQDCDASDKYSSPQSCLSGLDNH
jgi:hypothetical protein